LGPTKKGEGKSSQKRFKKRVREERGTLEGSCWNKSAIFAILKRQVNRGSTAEGNKQERRRAISLDQIWVKWARKNLFEKWARMEREGVFSIGTRGIGKII